MQLTIVSDLHLEVSDLAEGLPGGDLLVMAGDIFTAFPFRPWRMDKASRKERARYIRFATNQLSKYQKGFYVLGNHEYWREFMPDAPDLLREFLAEHAPNISLLDNQAETYEGISFIGTTLWASHGAGTAEEWRIRNGYGDFSKIWVASEDENGRPGRRRIWPGDLKAKHKEAVRFLHDEVKNHEKIVLISHHAPSWESACGIAQGTAYLDPCYCSDQVDFFLANPHIKLAIHGHTHRKENYQIGETLIRANPRGYFPFERSSRWFRAQEADIDLSTLF